MPWFYGLVFLLWLVGLLAYAGLGLFLMLALSLGSVLHVDWLIWSVTGIAALAYYTYPVSCFLYWRRKKYVYLPLINIAVVVLIFSLIFLG